MIDFLKKFKNVFWYIIEEVCTVLFVHISEKMNKYLRIVLHTIGLIVLYIIGLIYLVLSRMLAAHQRSPLPETYLICIKAGDVDIEPCFLPVVPDRFKTRGMCEKAVKKYLWLLEYVPDSFVTHQQIKIWHDNDDYCNDDGLIEWYEGYKKQKFQKSKIKEELLPISWHPDRVMD